MSRTQLCVLNSKKVTLYIYARLKNFSENENDMCMYEGHDAWAPGGAGSMLGLFAFNFANLSIFFYFFNFRFIFHFFSRLFEEPEYYRTHAWLAAITRPFHQYVCDREHTAREKKISTEKMYMNSSSRMVYDPPYVITVCAKMDSVKITIFKKKF